MCKHDKQYMWSWLRNTKIQTNNKLQELHFVDCECSGYLFIFLQNLKCALDPSSVFPFSFSFFFFLLLPGHLPHVHLIALLTGNGQSDNQRNKLFKVHLAVAVGVQVLHDFVHSCGVLLGLSFEGRSERGIQVMSAQKARGTAWVRLCVSSSHLEEVGQLVLHQLSQLPPTQRAVPALPGGIAVEDGDERLHGGLQLRRHGCCCVTKLQERQADGDTRRWICRLITVIPFTVADGDIL